MAQLSVDRKQRLRTLEKSIRGTMEQFVETGNVLKEIRDDELYREDGFDSWEQYLKQRVGEQFGIEKVQALGLIQAAIIRPKLPAAVVHHGEQSASEKPEWSIKAVKEFARLAPQIKDAPGKPRDVQSLLKEDVKRVAKAAVEIAKKQCRPVTAAIVRMAVNADLGIKPEKRGTAPRRDFGIDLPVYLNQKIGQIEGIIELLADVPADGWKLLEKSDPQLAERLATVCEELAELLRS